MKKLITSLATIVLLTACSSDSAEQLNANAQQVAAKEFTDAQRREVTDYFLSDDEPTVLDATWTDDKILKIGVKDDGSNRNSFAEYVCGEVNGRFGGKGKRIWVQVIDYPHLMKTKEWEKLGESHC